MRKSKKIIVCSILALCLSFGAIAIGGQADPLITLSKLKTAYLDVAAARANSRADDLKNAMASLFAERQSQAIAMAENGVSDKTIAEIASSVSQKTGGANSRSISLKKGDIVRGPLGAGFVLKSGSADIIGTELVNVTAGGVRKAGNYIARNIYYLIPQNDGSGIIITSNSAEIQLRDGASTSTDDGEKYYNYAAALSQMSLFRGTDKGYELSRAPTRLESLIMLIRLLGEERQALEFAGTHNFTDITGWADANKYIAYAVSRGYTTGISATEFAPNASANAATFYTFVLRALGYSDKLGDFEWNKTDRAKIVEIGILNQAEMEEIQRGNFMRGHTAFVMYRALTAEIKDTPTALIQKLITNGSATIAQYEAAQKIAK